MVQTHLLTEFGLCREVYANSFIATYVHRGFALSSSCYLITEECSMSERAEIHAEASEIISTERAGRAPALQPRKRPLVRHVHSSFSVPCSQTTSQASKSPTRTCSQAAFQPLAQLEHRSLMTTRRMRSLSRRPRGFFLWRTTRKWMWSLARRRRYFCRGLVCLCTCQA